MFSSIKSFGVSGVGGYSVAVEVYISNGMPGFEIVGLPDAAVKEARERVRAAIKNNGFLVFLRSHRFCPQHSGPRLR